MGILLAYNLKLSVCFVLFYLIYKIVLSKNTFYRTNRIVLISSYFIILMIPLLHIDMGQSLEVHKIIDNYQQVLIQPSVESTHQTTETIYTDKIPDVKSQLNPINLLLALYFVGIFLFALRSIYSFVRVSILIFTGERKTYKDAIVIVQKRNISPFSWMKYIIISQDDYNKDSEAILAHEYGHVKHRHSLDLLISEIFTIFQWYNPVIWLIKKELQDIHEYEADGSAIKSGIDAKEYQLLLIKKAVGSQRFNSMTNSFNHSKIKKRITMMLKEKSKPWARLKYLTILPLIAFSVVIFARPEVSGKLEKISVAEISNIIEKRAQIEGTWKRVKSSEGAITNESIKLITEDRFSWYMYNDDGMVINGAGGKYTYENGIYTEFIDFTMPGMARWRGKKAVYNIKIEKNKMIINGMLDDKYMIEEEWVRVK